MKKKTMLFALMAALASTAHASEPVNDTNTSILGMGDPSQPGDCSVIRPVEAHFSYFGDGGGAGEVFVINLEVQSLAYAKEFAIGSTTAPMTGASFQSSWSQTGTQAVYQGNANGVDHITLYDERVSGISGNYAVAVKMNGHVYRCGDIRVGTH